MTNDETVKLKEMIAEAVNASLEAFQRDQVKTLANIEKRFTDIDTQITALKTSSESRAQERAEAEVIEARQRLAIAEQRAGSLSTEERIQVKEMFAEHADQESRQRAQKRREFWDKVTPNLATGLIMLFAAPIALGLLGIVVVFLARVFSIPITPP